MASEHATCSKSGGSPNRRAMGRYDQCLDEGWIKGAEQLPSLERSILSQPAAATWRRA